MDNFEKESIMDFLDGQIAPKLTVYNQQEQDYIYALLIKFFAKYYCLDGFNNLERTVTTEKLSKDYVKLNWAHEDQYYVKTTKDFKDIEFLLKEDVALIFKIISGDVSRDNNKYFGKRFVVFKNVVRVNNKVEFYFEYKKSNDFLRQKDCNLYNLQKILDYLNMFYRLDMQKRKYQTLLACKLKTFTNIKNKDLFIHKDFLGFMRQEVDGFIKDELYSIYQ